MNVQHVNVKIHAAKPVPAELGGAIPIFHRWIQNRVRPELLIDVADYRHVPDGPGVLLIGFEANYSLDNSGGRLGLLYNRKKAAEGSTREQLQQAYDSARAAAEQLEREPEFHGTLRFDWGDCEIIFNDRLLVPNTIETWLELQPELEGFFAGLWGRDCFLLERAGEPRERLRIRATSHQTGKIWCDDAHQPDAAGAAR